MNDQIKSLIDSIVDENSVQAEKSFSDIMSDKLADRLDDYRKAIANSFFNPVTEENSTSDTGEGEHGDGQFPEDQIAQAQGEAPAGEEPAPADDETAPE